MIAQIEKRLREIEAGHFQKVCNLFVSRKYKAVFASGSQIETYKTTSGTPDAFFVEDDGSYTFIECTTQAGGLKNKIKQDILKCFEYVNNSNIKLRKIIYFHNSHVLSPKDHEELTTFCSNRTCELEIYDIAVLASELEEYPFLISDELNLQIDTGQIMPIEKFIDKYNRQKLTTPLNINLIGRENEVEELTKMISSQDVVLLFGKAGIGKTRLAVEVCKNFAEQHIEYSVLCIFNNDIDLFEDYRRYFSNKKNYLIFVDDCNQISSFRNLLEYVWNTEDNNIKIIATIRDYAKEKVLNDITRSESITYDLFSLTKLSDDSIKNICKENFGILNQKYLERIIDIAQGNPRLAVIASKLAVEGSLIDIYDATQLMERYYDGVINDSDLSKVDIVIVACTYLLKGIDFNDVTTVNTLLEIIDVDLVKFQEHALKMNRNEVIDYCENVAIKPSEQILSCYLGYCALFKFKFLPLSEFIIAFFDGKSKKIIDGLNGIFTYYRNEKIFEYFSIQIDLAWEYFELKKPELLEDFISSFHTIRPEKSLLHIKSKIGEMDFHNFTGKYILKRNQFCELPMELQMLGGYSELNDWKTAIDLVIQYARKRQDQFESIVVVLSNYNGFGVKENSNDINYQEQLYIYEELCKCSDFYKNIFFTNVLLEISKAYLNLGYEFSIMKNKNFIIGEIPLVFCDSSKQLREMIWKTLISLVTQPLYQKHMIEIFYSYDLRYKFESTKNESEFAHFDFEYIKKIFYSIDTSDFKMVHSISRILKKLNYYNIETSELNKICLMNETYKLYYLLVGEEYENKDYEYDEKDVMIYQEISEVVKEFDTNQYVKMINLWNTLDFDNEKIKGESWQLSNSIEYALVSCLNNETIDYKLILSKIINMRINNYSTYKRIASSFIEKIGVKDVEEVIIQYAIGDRLFMRQILLSIIIEDKRFSEGNLNHYFKILDEYIFEELRLNRTNILDFEILRSYDNYKSNFLIETLKRVRFEFCNGFAVFQSRSIFRYDNEPIEYIKLFADEYELLKELYFFSLNSDQNFDYDNKFLKELIREHVISISDYINFLSINKNPVYRSMSVEHLSCVWELKCSDDYVNEAFELLASSSVNSIDKYKKREIFGSLFQTKNKQSIVKQDIWIDKKIIEILNVTEKIDMIFEILSQLSKERMLSHIKTLLSLNVSITIFEKIRFEPRMSSWSGSELPQIDKRIEFLENIEELLIGAAFIEHKQYITNLIASLKSYRKQKQTKEFLEDF